MFWARLADGGSNAVVCSRSYLRLVLTALIGLIAGPPSSPPTAASFTLVRIHWLHGAGMIGVAIVCGCIAYAMANRRGDLATAERVEEAAPLRPAPGRAAAAAAPPLCRRCMSRVFTAVASNRAVEFQRRIPLTVLSTNTGRRARRSTARLPPNPRRERPVSSSGS